MIRKAHLADGTRPGLPVLPLARLERLLGDPRLASWVVGCGRSERSGRRVAAVGLGRDLCGATCSGLARRLGISASLASRLYVVHRAELRDGGAYAARIAELVRRGLAEWEDGPRRRPASV
jgi:hypothetical protein